MKIYEAKLQSNKGLKKVSLVLNPAVELTLQKFAEEKEIPTYFANQEKQIIYSVAMRPNKMIFRKDVNGEPANVFFSEETVEQCQMSYFKNNGNQATNLNHSLDNVEGVYPFESWIVADDTIDKAHFMKIDAKKGDWVMGFKIDNQDLWSNFIKTGKIDGLSVEAHLNYEITKTTDMTIEEKKENFFTHLMKYFAADEVVTEEVKKEEEMVDEPSIDEAAKEVAPTVKDWEEKYKLLEAENADLKEKLSTLEAGAVESATELETMKTQFENFKADAVTVKNLPNEKVKTFSEMTPLEKFRANK